MSKQRRDIVEGGAKNVNHHQLQHVELLFQPGPALHLIHYTLYILFMDSYPDVNGRACLFPLGVRG